MKKVFIISLLLVIFVVGVWLLNNFEVISVQAWCEKAIVNTPFLNKYVQTNEAYEELLISWQEINKENNNLKNISQEVQKELAQAQDKITKQNEQIAALESEVLSLKNEQKDKAAKVDKIVKIYSEMEPKDIANIFTALDKELALMLLQNLKEDKVAAILINLPPEKAAEFSHLLQ